MVNYKNKFCIECKKEYTPTGCKQKCCSPECLESYEKKYNREYAREYRKTDQWKAYSEANKKRYYELHKEELKESARLRYSQNKEHCLLKRKEYRETNPDKVKECKKQSYQKHIEKNNEKGRIYNQNPERKMKNSVRGLTRHFHKEDKKECSNCKSTENLEFHHPEPYNKDNFIVLCKECHLNITKPKMESIFN